MHVCVMCLLSVSVCQHEFRDGSESLKTSKLSAASVLHVYSLGFSSNPLLPLSEAQNGQ